MGAPYEMLKDFQPTLAAVIALTAAALAYRAAMAKVAFDRGVREQDRTDRKLGLFLRLRRRVEMLRAQLERIHAVAKHAALEGTPCPRTSSTT